MGILNITPDSFSDGGLFFDPKRAVDQGLCLEADGADILDIGGESTRPGALPVSLEEESHRVLPVLEQLVSRVSIPISIDTRKPEMAERAISAGASIINDVSAGSPGVNMFPVAAMSRTGLIMMHAKGTPQTMQHAPRYRNVIEEIYGFFHHQIMKAKTFSIALNRLALDPGIGFGKTAKHNLTIIHRLSRFTDLGVPVMLGPSRKSFIGYLLNNLPPTDREDGTAAAVAIAVFQGAGILRVHDVKRIRRVIRVAEGIRKEGL